MAVEYEIASDIAVISEVANTNQLAHVAKFYTGAVTYDDEASSKFATVTIDGKSQRVMLCIAVNGNITYDDVPCKYSTVDGHRCLNVVEPTGTEIVDDVPSVYETMIVDGKTVRAIRCVLINQTPIYDGVSSVCTFVDSGKTHTAQLVNVVGAGSIEVIVKGVPPLILPDAVAGDLVSLKAFGGTEQRNIPQPYTQVNYVTNTAQTAIDTGIMIDFAKNYEFEVECRAVGSSWYILQSRATSSGNITGISGATSGSTITLVVGNVTVCTSAITRTVGNKLYVKATLNAGTATLYVKDETANTEDTQTGSYGTSQPNPTAAVYLLGNAGGQYVGINSDIYMARIKENDTVVMDYVPARQAATAGFYDKASGTFKTALTPANLSADGETVPAPNAPMDIVSNNGVLKVSPNLFNKDLVADANRYINKNTGADSAAGSGEWRYSDYTTIEENTNYYVGVVNATASSAGLAFYDSTKTYISGVSMTQLGQQNNIITSPADTKYIRFSFRIDEGYNTDWENTVYLIKGNNPLAEFMPYGQIYADGTVETINAHGKNIFNKNDTASIGNWYSGATLKITSAAANQTLVMRAKPGATYYFKHCSVTGGGRAFYTEVEDWTLGSDCSAMSGNTTIDKDEVKSITVSANAKWVFFIYGRSGQTATFEEQLADYMVSLTPLTSDTQYTPYYDGGSAVAEMLLSIGNYTDEQEVISGAVTRKVGVKVLDGTEAWNTYTVTQGQLMRLTIADSVSGSKSGLGVLCNAYNVIDATSRTSGTLSGTTQNFDFLNSNYTTLAAWEQYLSDQYAAGTPVIIVYPLGTATTETVTGQPMATTQGDNIAEITQASLTGLELEVTYMAGVSLTVEEVEDAQLSPDVEVTIQ